MNKTEYILKIGKTYLYDYEKPEFSGLLGIISLGKNALCANRYKDLSEVENMQNQIGGEIYRVTTTVEKLEEEE